MMQSTTALFLAAAVLAAGCAAPRQQTYWPPVPASVTPPPPAQAQVRDMKQISCVGDKRCEAMWSDAQTAVGVVSTMRTRLLTNDRLETFAPTQYGMIGAEMRKIPMGDGYRLALTLECYRGVQCNDVKNAGIALFESMMSAYTTEGAPLSAPLTSGPPAAASRATAGAGQDSPQVERLPEVRACNATPRSILTAKGPGFEAYRVACTSGDTLLVRCEMGNCRVLK